MKDKPWFYAVHRADGGEPDAYAVYTMKHEWPRSVPTGTIEVRESMATTPQGYADIWRYLFDVDLVATVEAWSRPVDDPLLVLVARAATAPVRGRRRPVGAARRHPGRALRSPLP